MLSAHKEYISAETKFEPSSANQIEVPEKPIVGEQPELQATANEHDMKTYEGL